MIGDGASCLSLLVQKVVAGGLNFGACGPNLIHDGFATIAEDNAKSGIEALAPAKFNGPLQLVHFVLYQRLQPLDALRLVGPIAGRFNSRHCVQRGGYFRERLPVRFQVAIVPGQKKAALAAFSVLERRKERIGCISNLPRNSGLLIAAVEGSSGPKRENPDERDHQEGNDQRQ